MNTIVPHNHNFAIDQCIEAAWKPLDEATDWDSVIANAATLDADLLTAELIAGQPYPRNELTALRVFRLQTKTRIAIRYKRGLPQNAGFTCGFCGSRPAHAGRGLKSCLYCAESDYLIPQPWSPGDSSIKVRFDVASQTWGIAFVQRGSRTYSGAIIVNRFPNYKDAVLACNAPDRFVQIFNHVCEAGFQADEGTVFPIGRLFAQDLPMSPQQWREFCDGNFRSAQTSESEPYSWELRRTCEEYFRERRH
jgi:hypothetical protein